MKKIFTLLTCLLVGASSVSFADENQGMGVMEGQGQPAQNQMEPKAANPDQMKMKMKKHKLHAQHKMEKKKRHHQMKMRKKQKMQGQILGDNNPES